MTAGQEFGWPRWADPASVFGVALLARAIEALSDRFMFNDGPRFVTMATNFLAGDWRAALADPFHPLTALAMAAGHRLFGLDLEIAGEALSVLAGAVAALGIWTLAREQFGSRVALVAGLLFALHPRLRESSAGVQSDGLHLVWFAFAALFAWRALERRQLPSAALAGLCTGFAYLTRPEGLAVAVVMAGWLLADVAQRRLQIVRALSLGAAFGLVLAVVSAPYVLALHELDGGWSLTHKKDLSALATRTPERPAADAPPAPPPEPPLATPPQTAPTSEPTPPQTAPTSEPTPAEPSPVPPAAQDAPPEAASMAADAMRAATRAALSELLRDGVRAFHPILLALAALGLGVVVRSETRALRATAYALSYTALFLGLLLVVHLLAGYLSRRHFLPAAAMLVPLAGRGTVALGAVLQQSVPLLKARRVLPGLGIAIMLGIFIEMLIPKGEADKLAREDAARWLRDHHAPSVVASHRARDAYYAGATRHVILEGKEPSVEAMLLSAHAHGAQFAIFDVDPRSHRALPGWAHVLHREKNAGAEVLVLELTP